MKKLIFILAFGLLISCGERQTSIIDENVLSNLEAYKTQDSLENTTEKFIEAYIAAANTKDWKTSIVKYLPLSSDEFLQQHAAFRNSFPNYRSTIKHLTVDGNEGIVWLQNTGTYTSTYNFEDKYIPEVFNGIAAKNQELSWDETWYFDVVDGRFGENWDFLKDNHAVLEGLKADR